jgi:hypothetical protein
MALAFCIMRRLVVPHFSKILSVGYRTLSLVCGCRPKGDRFPKEDFNPRMRKGEQQLPELGEEAPYLLARREIRQVPFSQPSFIAAF